MVTTSTDWMDSIAGIYATALGRQIFVLLAPSMRVLVPCPLVPFTLKINAREGFPGMEIWLPGGEKPGSITNRFW